MGGDNQHFSLGCVKVETWSRRLNITVEYSLYKPHIALCAGGARKNKDPDLKELSFEQRRHISLTKE